MKLTTNPIPATDLDTSFFDLLIKRLNPMPTNKIIKTLHLVLTSLLHNQPAKKVNKLIKKLPPTLQLIFTGCWQTSLTTLPPANHLDELVENIYLTKNAKKYPVYYSRVEVLATVLIVIKALKMLFENIGDTILPHSIEMEYQQAVIEDAA